LFPKRGGKKRSRRDRREVGKGGGVRSEKEGEKAGCSKQKVLRLWRGAGSPAVRKINQRNTRNESPFVEKRKKSIEKGKRERRNGVRRIEGCTKKRVSVKKQKKKQQEGNKKKGKRRGKKKTF